MKDRPPVWADTWLRMLLPVRDRDTVSGDLMEEYCEAVRPTRSRLAADAWYVGQVSRFAWRPALWGFALAAIFVARTALDWFIPTTDFTPRSEATTIVMIATLLVIGTSSALRSRSIRAGTVATATALVVSAVLCSIATTVMYAAWSGLELQAAIVGSGGLVEVYTLPIMMIIPGTLIGIVGASVVTLPRRLDLG